MTPAPRTTPRGLDIPLDADGNIITLTLADLELVSTAAQVLRALLVALVAATSATDEMLGRDATLIGSLATAARLAPPNEGLIVSRDALVPITAVLVCWAKALPVVDAILANEGTGCDTRSMAYALTGLALPDAAAMTALHAKVARIRDAVNGQVGMRA